MGDGCSQGIDEILAILTVSLQPGNVSWWVGSDIALNGHCVQLSRSVVASSDFQIAWRNYEHANI